MAVSDMQELSDEDRVVELVNWLYELETELELMAEYTEEPYLDHYERLRSDHEAAATEYEALTGSPWTGKEDEEDEPTEEDELSSEPQEWEGGFSEEESNQCVDPGQDDSSEEPNQSIDPGEGGSSEEPNQCDWEIPICDQSWWEHSTGAEAPIAGCGESVCLAPILPNDEQGVLGVIVVEPDSAPLPDIEVEIQGPTAVSAATDAAGAVFFARIPVGDYEVVARTTGGNSTTGTITVEPGKTNSLELVLKPDERVLQFGIFFDGTGNNYKVDIRRADDKYEPTNVAKLHQLYRMDGAGKHYVNGVGTRDDALKGEEADYDDLDMAFGAGIRTRMNRAHTALRQYAKKAVTAQTDDRRLLIKLDVFGFSRGAATARFFANEVIKAVRTNIDPVRTDSRGRHRSPYLPPNVKIKLRFGGLFDTVGSVGMPGDEDEWVYNIHLHPDQFDAVVHLTAYNEKRANFPLTSILGGGASDKFREEALPGVHSDIGGGYGPRDMKPPAPPIYMSYSQVPIAQADRRQAQLQAEWEERMRDRGGRIEIERHPAPVPPVYPPSPSTDLLLYVAWVRNIDNALSRIALEKMHSAALESGVPLAPLQELGLLSPRLQYIVSDRLRSLNDRYFSDASARAELERDFMHQSHRDCPQPGAFLNPHAPERNPRSTAPNGVREMFSNRPGHAER